MKMVSEAVTDVVGNTLMRVTMTTESGKQTVRTISLEDYISLLGKSIKTERDFFNIRPGFLPEGYIDGWFADEANFTCIWKEPAAVRQLVHTSGHYMIPFPDLIFAITVRDEAVTRREVYVLAEDGETLLQYPFGNVSTCGGICTGNIVTKGMMRDRIAAFSEEFFFGKTNDDYFHEGSHIKPKYTQATMLRKLDGKKVFPKNWLKPMESRYVDYTLTGLRKSFSMKGFAA